MSLLARFKQRQPGNSLARILWWQFCHGLCVIWFLPFYRIRCYGVKNIPTTGPVLYVSNHQSMLDPIIVGMGSSHRQFFSLARKTLWDTKLLGAIMDTLNTIPVDQANPDASTMKRCIKILKAGHSLLIFPEGSRTRTGKTEAFEPGMMLIIKRAKPTVIPVAVEGAFDVWPRKKKLPKLFGRIVCQYGEPIPAEDLLAMDSKEAVESLRQTVESLRVGLVERMESL